MNIRVVHRSAGHVLRMNISIDSGSGGHVAGMEIKCVYCRRHVLAMDIRSPN